MEFKEKSKYFYKLKDRPIYILFFGKLIILYDHLFSWSSLFLKFGLLFNHCLIMMPGGLLCFLASNLTLIFLSKPFGRYLKHFDFGNRLQKIFWDMTSVQHYEKILSLISKELDCKCIIRCHCRSWELRLSKQN